MQVGVRRREREAAAIGGLSLGGAAEHVERRALVGQELRLGVGGDELVQQRQGLLRAALRQQGDRQAALGRRVAAVEHERGAVRLLRPRRLAQRHEGLPCALQRRLVAAVTLAGRAVEVERPRLVAASLHRVAEPDQGARGIGDLASRAGGRLRPVEQRAAARRREAERETDEQGGQPGHGSGHERVPVLVGAAQYGLGAGCATRHPAHRAPAACRTGRNTGEPSR